MGLECDCTITTNIFVNFNSPGLSEYQTVQSYQTLVQLLMYALLKA